MSSPDVRVRGFRATDREDLLRLSQRMSSGIAPWREQHKVVSAAEVWVQQSIDGHGGDGALFVAEGESGHCLGFVSVTRKIHYTGDEQAYVGELVVAREADGQGIGRALMARVEAWAGQRGLRFVTLETGADNQRAREFYRRLGYQEESLTLTRVLY